jgi:hypothetical protein
MVDHTASGAGQRAPMSPTRGRSRSAWKPAALSCTVVACWNSVWQGSAGVGARG